MLLKITLHSCLTPKNKGWQNISGKKKFVEISNQFFLQAQKFDNFFTSWFWLGLEGLKKHC